jgi:membrane-associated progesterone receptor component
MPFAPKTEVKLDPPQHHVFTNEELAHYDGVNSEKIYVGIKGTVFDVSNNRESYGPEAGYHVFVGKDASRALAKSSLKPEDAVPNYSDLADNELKVLEDWYLFFSQRYNVVGTINS